MVWQVWRGSVAEVTYPGAELGSQLQTHLSGAASLPPPESRACVSLVKRECLSQLGAHISN